MINLVKKQELSLGILETDFDIYEDIVNTFTDENLKRSCLNALENYTMPEYFLNKMTIIAQMKGKLIGYACFEFKNNNNVSQVIINRLYVFDEYKDKKLDSLLIESVIYIAGEIGSRNVVATVNEQDLPLISMYQDLGFYEVGMNEDGNLLSVSVLAAISSRKLNEKFRDILPDSVDYRSLKLIKKIASGKSANIYLTQDGQILKMFTSTSFTYIKDREETLKYIKQIDNDEIVKPKHLVYYDGVFVGYIMEYLPDGEPLWLKSKEYSFEQKIERIKTIENLMKSLHEKNIYICDLNPSNIFFDKKGNIKLIGCDSFVIKNNVVNSEVSPKYKDPFNKIISEKTDLYAFAITSLQLLIDEQIDDNLTTDEIEKIYSKNRNKLPVSFQNYYDKLFKSKERYYLTDAYELYLNEMYDENDTSSNQKSGKISIIILSFIMITIAVIGYLVFRFLK